MDRFAAAISLDPRQSLPTNLADQLGQVLQSPGVPGSAKLSQWSDSRVALACLCSNRASDAIFHCPLESPNASFLTYFNGPVGLEAASGLKAIERLLEEEGPGIQPAFSRLNGSFHGLIYKPATGQVWLLADRLASRTLFYSLTDTLLLAASDVAALLALPGVSAALDIGSLSQFVRYQMILGQSTLYRQVKTLPGGHCLYFDGSEPGFSLNRYWTLQPLAYYSSQEEAIEATAQAFVEATCRGLAGSDQPALLLSGGMDSRMLVAAFGTGDRTRLHSVTFGSLDTYETQTARRVAQQSGLAWQFIGQGLEDYWDGLAQEAFWTNGLHSLAHTHLRYPAHRLAESGYDTLLHGWALDAFYSGSYLPKRYYNVLGRSLTDYRLLSLHNEAEVVVYLHDSLDIQKAGFEYSLLGSNYREAWLTAPREALQNAIRRQSGQSDQPYDWIEYALFGEELARFRSTPMMTSLRTVGRERNPLLDNSVIEVYQRLPYQWRFLGPVYRRALQRLSPSLMSVPYSNLGVSPLAPPWLQALSFQSRTAWLANTERLSRLTRTLQGRPAPVFREKIGNYLYATQMAGYLCSGTAQAQYLLDRLRGGPLAEAGLLDPARLDPALQRVSQGDSATGFTLMAWITLALWFESQSLQL